VLRWVYMRGCEETLVAAGSAAGEPVDSGVEGGEEVRCLSRRTAAVLRREQLPVPHACHLPQHPPPASVSAAGVLCFCPQLPQMQLHTLSTSHTEDARVRLRMHMLGVSRHGSAVLCDGVVKGTQRTR
jgi:hypothetical protein